jgi:hypothetical protein
MKNQDDGTLSLFDDFPPAPTKAAETQAKKPRPKRKVAQPAGEPLSLIHI